MGHELWYEITERPKDAIINNIVCGDWLDGREVTMDNIVKSRWLNGGILLELDTHGQSIFKSKLLYIRNCWAKKKAWSYRLVANDNPLTDEDCERYGLKFK